MFARAPRFLRRFGVDHVLAIVRAFGADAIATSFAGQFSATCIFDNSNPAQNT
jgi:hypothetical protein